ncbi:MAG TPA: hypothetical protein VHD32_00965 [Candidatus Didemnitutus sp.]|nr:hypothetical protein [Candidatus Didemnitutus sp.]
MTPFWRKLGLAAHVTASVGWLGAVAAFLALSIAGLTSREAETVRGAYLAMNLIGEFTLVPLSILAVVTGLFQSLGTEWGLFRYYWVAVKLVLTFGATLLLLLHQFTEVAAAARRVSQSPSESLPEVGALGFHLARDAGLGLLVLLVITALSIFKPWGRTRFGQASRRAEAQPAARLPAGLKVFLAIAAALAVGLALLHHLGGGHSGHSH